MTQFQNGRNWGKRIEGFLRRYWFRDGGPVKPPKDGPDPTPPILNPPPPANPTPVNPPVDPNPPTFQPFALNLLDFHNDQRKALSINVALEPLSLDVKLCAAAQSHADWMASNQKMTHTGANGSSPGDRISSMGYSSYGWGENIAMGHRNEEIVTQGWMNSSGHRKNILNESWIECGFGLKVDNGGRKWWAAVFAIPRSSARGDEFVQISSGSLFYDPLDSMDIDSSHVHVFRGKGSP